MVILGPHLKLFSLMFMIYKKIKRIITGFTKLCKSSLNQDGYKIRNETPKTGLSSGFETRGDH